MSAVAEAPNEARPVTELKPPREKKDGNGGDPKTFSESFANVVENQAYVGPKGLLKQIDELKVDLTTMKKEKADARELAQQIKEALMDRSMKEEQKKQLGKAIDGVQADIDRLTSELIALEMGYHQPRLPFGETVEKKKADKPEAEAWRKVLLSMVMIGGGTTLTEPDKKLLEKLKDGLIKNRNDAANIKTLGDITDFLAKNKLTDIKGIGAATAKKIEDAMEKWWAAHPEMVPPKEETKPAPAETKDAAGDSSKYLTPADLAIMPGMLAQLCHATLVADAPYADEKPTEDKIPKLHGAVTYNGGIQYVVTPHDKLEETYVLRSLLEPSAAQLRHTDDAHCGRLVLLDGKAVELGPVDQSLLAKEQIEPAQAEPAPEQKDETVPLKEAMGDKPKKKKGRNRRK